MEKKKHGIEKEGAAHIEKNLDSAAGEMPKPQENIVTADAGAAVVEEEPIPITKQLEEALAQKTAEASANWDKCCRSGQTGELSRVQRERKSSLFGNESCCKFFQQSTDGWRCPYDGR
jgi:hypothetical protein